MERLGASALDGIAAAGALAATFAATWRGVFRRPNGTPAGTKRRPNGTPAGTKRPPDGTPAGTKRARRPPGEVAGQMFVVGNKSLLFIAVTLGFIGMVMVYQSCLQLERITGDLSQVGPEFLKLLVQDLGPTITALMLATRVGAGIAAEIGSMVVTEQVDALRMSGVTPIDYLVAPRFIACVVMGAVMTVFGVLIAYVAGGLTAWSSFDLNPRLYFDPGRVGFFDVTLGLVKTVSYGMAIPVISGFCGLRARGSSEGVGAATTSAVIGSSLAVIILDLLLSGAGLVLRGQAR